MHGSISVQNASVEGDKSIVDEGKASYELDEIRGYNVQQFLGCLGRIRQKSGLDAIFIFIDEFSDLTDDEQERFSALLKKLLGSKNNIYFKVGTITDRFYFGKDIIIGRDIYPIYLDLSDFVERYGGIVPASKELIIYTEELIQKRLYSLAGGLTMNDVFKGNKNEILTRISREAMGVPRTIGLVLQNALTQAEVRNEKFIQVSDINVGIRETRKIYFKQFQGAVQKKVRNTFMSKELQIRNSTVDFLVFTRDAGEDGIEVRVQNGDVWLTQKAISQLFDVDRSVVTKHLSNIFKEGDQL